MTPSRQDYNNYFSYPVDQVRTKGGDRLYACRGMIGCGDVVRKRVVPAIQETPVSGNEGRKTNEVIERAYLAAVAIGQFD